MDEKYEQLHSAAKELVEAVEKYVEPKPGDAYFHRTRLIGIKNNLKKILK